MTRHIMVLGLIVLAGTPTALSAQEQNALHIADELTACRSLKDSAERLSCYDRTAEALSSARQRKDLVIVDRAQMRKTREALFGFSLPKIRIFGGDEGDAGVKEITSTIAAQHDMGYGKAAWTLADGSIWQMTESSPGGRTPKLGDPIVVRAGILGSYIAVIRGDQYKVKRVR